MTLSDAWLLCLNNAPEFSLFLETVEESPIHARLFHSLKELIAAIESTYASDFPSVVVVLTGRPNPNFPQQAAEVRRRLPLTSHVVIAGAWCEGETRTGQPWPSDMRVRADYAHFWWRVVSQDGPKNNTFTDLPTVASAEDVLLRSVQEMKRRGSTSNPALRVVISGAPETTASWRDALQLCGIESVVIGADTGGEHQHATCFEGNAAIWCGGGFDIEDQTRLANFVERMGESPVLALVDFPRWDAIEAGKKLGATEVWGRPTPLWLVEAWLYEVTRPALHGVG